MEKEPECKSRRTWTHGGTAEGKGRPCLGEFLSPGHRWPFSFSGDPVAAQEGQGHGPKETLIALYLEKSSKEANSLGTCQNFRTFNQFFG